MTNRTYHFIIMRCADKTYNNQRVYSVPLQMRYIGDNSARRQFEIGREVEGIYIPVLDMSDLDFKEIPEYRITIFNSDLVSVGEIAVSDPEQFEKYPLIIDYTKSRRDNT